MSLLLLDLDDTVADRAAAFDHWAHGMLARWAPGDPEAHGFLISQDDDGQRPRVEFLQTVANTSICAIWWTSSFASTG